jgi:hypothetical protein
MFGLYSAFIEFSLVSRKVPRVPNLVSFPGQQIGPVRLPVAAIGGRVFVSAQTREGAG